MAIVLEISPLDPTSGTRKALRVSAHDDSRVTGLNGQRWWPGVVAPPTLRLDGWDGSFASSATLASASAQIDPVALRKLDQRSPAYRWAGAPLRIWQGEPGEPWSAWREIFTGLVNDYGTDENGRYTFSAQVDGEPFEADLLNRRYAGTGAAEGGESLKDKPKPALFGRARNIEPVQIDAVNLVYQVHGYGSIRAVTAIYERAASLIDAGGKNIGDFANYGALVAASIPEGSFGTCLAQGMFRLGAPPAGLITIDADGDNANGFVRSTAAVITRMCALAAVDPARVDASSMAALDTAVPHPINLYLTSSTTLLQMVQPLAQACNAQAIVDWTGKLRVIRFGAIPSPSITLDAQGRRLPPVLANQEVNVSPPYWRIEMRGARCWRAHGMDEIAFAAPLVPRGDYVAAETYREGNIVEFQGSSWLYINTTPGAGNAPPAPPATENGFWSLLSSVPSWNDIADPTGTKPQDNADVTGENTSKDTNAVGGKPAVDLLKQVDDAKADIDGLFETYGETVSAAQSAIDAAAARDAAAEHETNAELANSLSQTAKTDSQAARDASQAAQTLAQNAKGAAEAAASVSTTARDVTTTARNDAQNARDAAQAALGLTNTAKGAAETARTGAETARDAAVAAKNLSDQAKTDAQSALSLANTARDTAIAKAGEAGTSASQSSASAVVAASSAKDAAGAALTGNRSPGASPSSWGYNQQNTFAPTLRLPVAPGTGQFSYTATGNLVVGTTVTHIHPVGLMSVQPGRRYRPVVRWRLTEDGAQANGHALYVYFFDASGAYINGGQLSNVTGSAVTVAAGWQEQSRVLAPTTAGGAYAIPATAAFMRVMFRTSGTPEEIALLYIEDVEAQMAADSSATAASTSASAASTKAGEAGTSASAAKTSETNAGTSAGNAKTSETNAASSSQTAAGHASTATTQAGLAAGSATAAGGSATAAAGSASTAGTKATDAGNSATAANTSALNAASSYSAAKATAIAMMPDTLQADTLAISIVGTPESRPDLPAGWVVNGVVSPPAGASRVLAYKGYVPWESGKIYEVTTEFAVDQSDLTPAPSASPYARQLTDVFGGSTDYHTLTTTPVGQTTRMVTRFGMDVLPPAATGIVARQMTRAAGTVFARFGVLINYTNAAQQSRLKLMTVRDVTAMLAAQGSAAAAVISASAASTSADTAGQKATVATTAATNAETARGQAQTYASNAATSADSALGSANTATTQAGLSTTARNQADGFASAAQGSASTASSKASEAEQSASSATASANTATTKAGEASTFASNAATSASTAEGHKNSASTSAGVAANSASAAQLARINLLPERYDATGSAIFQGSLYGAPTASPATALPSNATETGYGPVIDVTATTAAANVDTALMGVLAPVPGRIYKMEVEYQTLAMVGSPTSGSNALAVNMRILNANYTNITAVGASFPITGVDAAPKTVSRLFSAAPSTLGSPWPVETVWLRPYARLQLVGPTSMTVRIRRITVTDVTESTGAAGSASAAATSASTASTAKTNAETAASAATTAKTAAETAKGLAETYRNEAASSRDTASGHASTAATQAGIATSSYQSALSAAIATMPDVIKADLLTPSTGIVGAPETRANLPAAQVVNGVYSPPAGSTAVALYKSVVPWQLGKIYEVAIEVAVDDNGFAAPTASPYARALNASYGASTVGERYIFTACAPGQTTRVVVRFGLGVLPPTAPGILASQVASAADNAFVRFGALLNYTTVANQSRLKVMTIRDVTAMLAAEGSATAAQTSAATASTKAGEAGTSAETASSQRGLAETARGQAQTYASNAATSAGNADTSATTATTQAGLSTTARNQADGFATAAQGSASTASTKADAASQSASVASGHANTASTKAGEASTKAGEAATSASTAEGHKNSAASSASVSATSAGSANLAAAKLFPDRYESGGQFFLGNSIGDPATVADYPSNATATGYGPVRQEVLTAASSRADFSTRAVQPAVPGRIYKVEAEFQTTAFTGTPTIYLAWRAMNAAYASLGTGVGAGAAPSAVPNNSVQKLTALISDVAQPALNVASWPAGTLFLRPFIQAQNTATSTMTIQFRRLTVTDVTEAMAAQASASAASTSASTASTAKTNAETAASASSTAKDAAETARGQAEGFRNQAATSAENAAGSSSAASISAGVAASSRDAAASFAARNLVAKGTFADGSIGTWAGAAAYLLDAGVGAIRATNRDSFETAFRPIVGARKLRVTVQGRAPGSFALFAGVQTRNAAGTSNYPVGNIAPAGSTVYRNTTVDITLPADTVEYRPIIVSDGPGGAAGHDVRVRSIYIEDVTDSEAAKASATAAATSADTANTKASEAGTAANTATTAKNNAETAKSNAESAAGRAATSETNAAGSASTASTQAGLAATARGQADGFASAAQGSASTASTKAGEAGTSASTANTHRGAAETARGQAETFRNEAAASRDAASGSASTAMTQAGIAADYATGARSDSAKSYAKAASDSQVLASQNAAAAQTSATLSAQYGLRGGNLVPNTEWVNDWQGWGQYWSSNAPNVPERAVNGPTADWYIPGQRVFYARQTGRVGAGDPHFGFYSSRIPVSGNTWYQFYMDLFAHRCDVETLVEWFDGNSNYLGVEWSGRGGADAPSGRSPNNYKRVGRLDVRSPSNAAFCHIHARKYDTYNGSADSYMWLWRAYFGAARQGQTEWNAFQSGPTADVITGQIASVTQMAGAVSDIDERTRAYLQNTVQAGTSVARLSMYAESSPGVRASAIELAADAVYIGSNRVLEIANGEVRVRGKVNANDVDLNSGRLSFVSNGYRLVEGAGLGPQSNMVMWYGPNSVAVGSETVGNSRFALGTDGKVYYGATEIGTGKTVQTVGIGGTISKMLATGEGITFSASVGVQQAQANGELKAQIWGGAGDSGQTFLTEGAGSYVGINEPGQADVVGYTFVNNGAKRLFNFSVRANNMFGGNYNYATSWLTG
jgi:hypothetical protein